MTKKRPAKKSTCFVGQNLAFTFPYVEIILPMNGLLLLRETYIFTPKESNASFAFNNGRNASKAMPFEIVNLYIYSRRVHFLKIPQNESFN